MENLKIVVLPIVIFVAMIINIYTVIEGFVTGKIKTYSHSPLFRVLGEKPLREYSLNFDTTYFWIEVGFDLFYALFCGIGLFAVLAK